MPADGRKRGRRADSESGFTLIEMVISMSLLTVVLTFCLVALVSLQRSVSTADARTQSVDQVRLAVQQIDREVRSGNIFYSPFDSGYSVVVFTQANGNQRCMEWHVDTSTQKLESRSWTQTWQTDGSPSVVPWSTIATGVTNGTTGKTPFVLDNTSSYGGRILDIDLTTDATNSQSGGSETTDSVEGRNTVYGYSATACSQPWPATS